MNSGLSSARNAAVSAPAQRAVTASLRSTRGVVSETAACAQLPVAPVLLESTSAALCIVAASGIITYANQAYLRLLAYNSLAEISGTAAANHLADPAFAQKIAADLGSYTERTIELLVRRKNGSTFDASVDVRRSFDAGGNSIYICTVLNVSEQKRLQRALQETESSLSRSEEELRALAGSMLLGQEEERRRIARDLHDDVTQELASISIDLGTLAAGSCSGTDLSTSLRSLQKRTVEVSNVVRHVSHGLHPSILEDLGLSAALEAHCEEFSRVEAIPVRFRATADDTELSTAEASCLYRIAQESLRNAAKHAHASHVQVELRRDAQRIYLLVRDDGIGMGDLSSNLRERPGLGLITMEERMRLVSGTLSVTSSSGHGTDVIGSIPIRTTGRGTFTHTAG